MFVETVAIKLCPMQIFTFMQMILLFIVLLLHSIRLFVKNKRLFILYILYWALFQISAFSFDAKRRLVAATFMPVFDYGDMQASSQSPHSLDTVYLEALRFFINLKALTHHCSLCVRVGWPAMSIASYLCNFINLKNAAGYCLCSYLSLIFILKWEKGLLVRCPCSLESPEE